MEFLDLDFDLTIKVNQTSKDLFGKDKRNVIDLLNISFISYWDLKDFISRSFLSNDKTIIVKKG